MKKRNEHLFWLLIAILFALLMAMIVSSANADYGYVWYNITVAQLPATCTAGQIMAVNDADDISDCTSGGGTSIAICACNETEDGWYALSMFSTYAKWDRAILPTCGANYQDESRVDADGDLCFCDGSSWELLNTTGGTACVSAAPQSWTDSAATEWTDSAATEWQDSG